MRIIKFRIWDGEDMLPVGDSIEFRNALFHKIRVTHKYDDLREPDCKDFHLMQFTGLTDKNGKEIYEGDILNYGNYRGSSNLNGKACNHIVKWDVDNACFSTKAIYESDTLFPLDSFAEIIGNIHENADLLNSTK